MGQFWSSTCTSSTPGGAAGRARGRALREAIQAGRLRPGTRLPPSRTLARDLGVARNTVAEAYGQLVAEGWLAARRGRARSSPAAAVAPRPQEAAAAAEPRIRFDLRPGRPDLGMFPRAAWLAATRRALAAAPGRGSRLRRSARRARAAAALAGYLGRARGVRHEPRRDRDLPGFMHGARPRCASRCAPAGRGAARWRTRARPAPRGRNAAGLEIVPIEVDERGARVEGLERSGADVALVTPAHQFPSGDTARAERRRRACVDWATAGGRLVIEDDYDGEFRYDRQPIGAMQALATRSTSSTRARPARRSRPAFGSAWLALPEWLARPIVDIKKVNERQLPFTDELALAELIESGDWDRHVRRMRGRHRARRDRFVAMLAERAPSARAVGISAGLHAVVELPEGGPTEKDLVIRARERSIGLFPLGPFWHRPRRRPQALVVGYGSPPEHRYEAALRELGDVLSIVG